MMDNAVRGRFNAWLLDALDGYMHRKYGPLKTRLFGAVPATVIDLGAGSGANFRYFPAGTRVVAVEPSAHMHARLEQKARHHGLALEIHEAGGETLALPDASVDLVCASLVLCSVLDPPCVVAEVRRVLRPGGRFVTIEHITAPPGSGTAAIQRAVRRPWRWVFEGCELCNQTAVLFRSAGFHAVQIEPFRLSTVFLPLRYQIAVTCTA